MSGGWGGGVGADFSDALMDRMVRTDKLRAGTPGNGIAYSFSSFVVHVAGVVGAEAASLAV